MLFGDTYTHEAALNPSGNPAAVRSTAEKSYDQRSMLIGYGRGASFIRSNQDLIQDQTCLGAPRRVDGAKRVTRRSCSKLVKGSMSKSLHSSWNTLLEEQEDA